ncbi:hypothetical protein QEO94_00090 [Kingella negevensis]|uniref:hypothetical protein n=1 Tax=Kingella negevensis TaxID=1522312 RepID=UPI002542B00C|nr:hypothetical protein [Kingella negevensis]WII93300.1 hypothetical protein QEO94_00090 [Kingella negevensis]
MLQNQIKKATELGFGYFYLYADRGANQDFNGCYSWARLGFNASIPQGLHLPDFLRNCEDILDIVSNEEGAKWWKENGIPVNMEFDLSTNSKSMKYFEKYVQNK